MVQQVKNKKDRPSKIRSVAYLAPLFAAVFAPFSTLLDIPALTQPVGQPATPAVTPDPPSF